MRQIDDLMNEIMDLKACQIDTVKIAIGLFTFVSSVLALLIGGATRLFILHGNNFCLNTIKSSSLGPFIIILILLLSITPISFPLFIRIIIHKCRSIFRILGYIRLVEELKFKGDTKDFKVVPYELAYNKVRDDYRLKSRFAPKKGQPIKNFLKRWLPGLIPYPVHSQNKDIEKSTTFDYAKKYYIGKYYNHLCSFLIILSSMHIIVFIFIACSWLWMFEFQYHLIEYTAAFSLIILLLWFFYSGMLIRRYIKEIENEPFSIEAWYLMFKDAFSELAG